MALVSYDSSGDEMSDDDTVKAASKAVSEYPGNIDLANDDGDRVEPEYKMRVPKSAKLPNLIPNLKTSKTKSGKVLLSIPTIDELNSSDDSEDEDFQQSSKRSKKPLNRSTTQTGSSLLSLLPPTRALIVREGTKPMIPHQLAVKRPLAQKVGARIDSKEMPTSEKTKQTTLPDDDNWESTAQNGADDDDNDAEMDGLETDGTDASSSFFSFYRPEPQDEKAVAGVRQAAASSLLQSMMSVTSSVPASMVETKLSTDTVQPTSHTENKPTQPVIHTPALFSIDPNVLQNLDVPKPVQPSNESEANEEQYCWSDETFIPGPERKRARLNLPGVRSTVPVDELLSSSNQPIHEVSQDDLTAGAKLELMKSVTSDEAQYVSHRARPEDEPGKLAHRKHQITWLAYQAQEKEVELEKRWAEARRNKATNRAKYGF